jgi:hypothetical protein
MIGDGNSLIRRPVITLPGRRSINSCPAWMLEKDATSPTATLEGIMLKTIIDAKEEQDVMSADIPNAFIQA